MWNFMSNILGGLIGAGGSLLGSQENAQAQALTNQANMQMNQQNIAAQEAINTQNIAEQEKFAQTGVQWKVADAAKAGINPLAALGANTASFSNVVAPQANIPMQAGTPGTGAAAAGQNLARAIQATQSPEDQAIAAQKTSLDLEGMQLDNDYKRSLIASNLATARQAGVPPGLGINQSRGGMQRLPGQDQDVTLQRNSDGTVTGIPSKETQQGVFGNSELMWEWMMRNRVMPSFGFNIPKGLPTLPRGSVWRVNPVTGTYYEGTNYSDYIEDVGRSLGDYPYIP